MRTRSMRLAAVLAAGLLLPALAAPLELGGHLGLTYQRTDTWVERAVRSVTPRLDLDLGLVASDYVQSREFLAWRLEASWRRLSEETDSTQSSVRNALFFGARASLFSDPKSPLSLSLDGSRTFTRFSSSGSLDVTGDTVTQSYGALATVRTAERPTLTLGYRWNDTEATIQGLAPHTRTIHFLNAGTGLGSSSFNMTASYAGELSDGSFTTDRYDTHRATVSARAPLTASSELYLEEQYLTTRPTSLLAAGALEQESNFFRAFGRNSSVYGDRQVASYSYGRLISQSSATPLAEATRQALRYEGDLLLTSPTLFTRWSLDASLNQARAGTTALDSSGETLGVQLWWRRPGDSAYYEVAAGPLVGFFQSDTAGDTTGYGAAAHARASQPWYGQVTTLSYRLDWGTDLHGAKGSVLRQDLSASVGGGLLDGRYSVSLSAGAFKTSSPVFGDGAGRTLSLYLNGTFRDLTVDASVLLQQGVEGATPRDFVSDGLFIPAPFDSRTLQAHARGTYELHPGLSTTGQLRWLSSTHPGRPAMDQTEVLASLQYRYGAFTLAVEDRYGWVEQATGSSRINQFMFRFYRQLGWGR